MDQATPTAETVAPKDVRGITLRPGQRVTYPIRQGARMWLNVGTITVVGEKKIQVAKELPSKRTVTLRNLSQVAVLGGAK